MEVFSVGNSLLEARASHGDVGDWEKSGRDRRGSTEMTLAAELSGLAGLAELVAVDRSRCLSSCSRCKIAGGGLSSKLHFTSWRTQAEHGRFSSHLTRRWRHLIHPLRDFVYPSRGMKASFLHRASRCA